MKDEKDEGVKFQEILTMLMRFLYFMHLILIAIYMLIMIIYQHRLKYATFTFIILCIYCFMIIWVPTCNCIIMLCNRTVWAMILNKLIVKTMIMGYPILFVVSFFMDFFFYLRSVKYLMLYLILASFVLTLYELYVCTCGQHENPTYIFRENNLSAETSQVWNQRAIFMRKLL